MAGLSFTDPDIQGAIFDHAGVYLLLDKDSLSDAQDDQGLAMIQLTEIEVTALEKESCATLVARLHSDATLIKWVTCNLNALNCFLSSPADRLFISRRDLSWMAKCIKDSRGVPAWITN
ncbi:hypothetical protein [Aeromonas veronii]|uniref:Uncharacterized protein n=1 Tax=Aeromonas veronii TaxID=654 RepID=A0A4S5CPF2_AERVE|nr:hypothetical protein [Aeromonas veronii]THJ45056.1 hypothetical protein E8Q35_12795 [Aeromonas veronii]